MTTPQEQWKRTPFEGELAFDWRKINLRGSKLRTPIGDFMLSYTPIDESHLRIVRRGNKVVIGYWCVDECPGNPLEDMDGYGHIYKADDDRSDFQDALGIDQYGGIDISDLGDEPKDEAIWRAAQQLHARRYSGHIPHSFEWAGSGLWNACFTVSQGTPFEELITYQFMTCSINFKDYVVMHGNALEVGDYEPIEAEMWLRDRKAGVLGEKWAVLLRWCGEDLIVKCKWEDIKIDEYDSARLAAVWVPCEDLTEDIEKGMTGKAGWDRALELAKESAEIWSLWRNGYVYTADADVFTLVQQSEDPDEDWARWSNDDTPESCGGIYGSDGVEETIQDMMEEALASLDKPDEQGETV